VGIETAFPLLYTHLVETGILPLGRLIELMCVNPRNRFRISGGIAEGDRAALTVFDLRTDAKVDPADFLSAGKATPFEGWPVHAVCRMTMTGDDIVYGGDGL